MYKRNKYVLIFSIGISVLSCIFIHSNLLMILISLIILFTDFSKKHKKMQILTLLFVVFNNFCGKLVVFCKILLFFDVFLWITRYLSKKDLLIIFSSFFKNTFYKKSILFILLFPNLFMSNYNKYDYYYVSKNILTDLKKIFSITLRDFRNILIEFEKRLFFNKSVKFDSYINNHDFVTLSFCVFMFCFSTLL